jgi:hypothetical protein
VITHPGAKSQGLTDVLGYLRVEQDTHSLFDDMNVLRVKFRVGSIVGPETDEVKTVRFGAMKPNCETPDEFKTSLSLNARVLLVQSSLPTARKTPN